MKSIDWYNNLNKPYFNPPSEIFTPVWGILYLMIFLSFVFFIKNGINKEKTIPIIFFSIQLILNFSWQKIFFGMHSISGAFIVAVLLWIFILLTIITFYKHSKTAALLLIPYLIWTAFACFLNFEYMKIN